VERENLRKKKQLPTDPPLFAVDAARLFHDGAVHVQEVHRVHEASDHVVHTPLWRLSHFCNDCLSGLVEVGQAAAQGLALAIHSRKTAIRQAHGVDSVPMPGAPRGHDCEKKHGLDFFQDEKGEEIKVEIPW